MNGAPPNLAIVRQGGARAVRHKCGSAYPARPYAPGGGRSAFSGGMPSGLAPASPSRPLRRRHLFKPVPISLGVGLDQEVAAAVLGAEIGAATLHRVGDGESGVAGADIFVRRHAAA